jgi:hypothetical protein
MKKYLNILPNNRSVNSYIPDNLTWGEAKDEKEGDREDPNMEVGGDPGIYQGQGG